MTYCSRTCLSDFANVVSFLISIFSIFALCNYYITNDVFFLSSTVNVIFFQLSYDIFLWHSNESALHHFFVILFGTFLFYYEMKFDDYFFLMIPILATEISTLFLVLKIWMEQFDMKKTIWFTINNVFFFVSFFITRIYIYTAYIIANPQTYSMISKYTGDSIIAKFHVYTGLVGLFCLNVYWLVLMIKILSKQFKYMTVEYYPTQFFYSTGQVVNIGIYTYFYGLDNLFSADSMGMILVAVTSYFLHSPKDANEYTPFFFLFNLLSMQIRSILFMFSNLGMMFGHISTLYHFVFIVLTLYLILFPHDNRLKVTGKTLLIGGLFPLYCVTSLMNLMNYPNYYIFPVYIVFCLIFYSFPLFYISIAESLMFPLFVDLLQVVYFIEDFNLKVALSIVSYVGVLLFYMKPWYEHNLVLLNLVSYVHTGILCVVNK